jgi:CO/xanthine dehydrogenase FAD-binding subunit
MINFHYTRPNDVADAVRQIAAEPGAKFIAGGTNMIDLMKDNVERPTGMLRCQCKVPLACSQDLLAGLRLGRASGRLRERADDGAARKVDLERVVLEALGVA